MNQDEYNDVYDAGYVKALDTIYALIELRKKEAQSQAKWSVLGDLLLELRGLREKIK